MNSSSPLPKSSTSSANEAKGDVVLIQFRVSKNDCKNLHAFVEYLYQHQAISRPSVPLLGKVALFKIYNEFIEIFRTERQQRQQRKQQPQTAEDNNDWF
jgi:hypothetical protein